MQLISFLLRKRNCKQLHAEPTPKETNTTIQLNDNCTNPSLHTDSMLHLSYPFYLLSRAPR
jgi:hypothetical protein